MLQSGKAEYKDFDMFGRWLDVAPYDGIIANQPSPRVLTSHLALSWLAPNLRYDYPVMITMFYI